MTFGGTSGGTASASSDLSRQLEQFNLEDAHCFDPNEDCRLRRVFEAGLGGSAAFTSKIKALAPRLDEVVQRGTKSLSQTKRWHKAIRKPSWVQQPYLADNELDV